MKHYSEAYEGEWDFHGACAPKEDGSSKFYNGQDTFTLGCFQWVRRGKSGQFPELKKGPVKYRVKGMVTNPKPAYETAREYCAKKNNSVVPNKK